MDSINDLLVSITGQISDYMYTFILVLLLVATGIFFTCRTGFVQIRNIKQMFTSLFGLNAKNNHRALHNPEGVDLLPEDDLFEAQIGGDEDTVKTKRISSFQALMVSTASRVGTGNIAGVTTAVALGGPGAILWMWVMSIIGAASAFIESTLAQIWKVKNPDGTFRGGPAYYIQQALGKRWLGVVFAVALILCFAFGFNGLQVFNAVSAIDYYVSDSNKEALNALFGILFVLAAAVVIFGGTHRISVITSVIVPFMGILYVGIALFTVFSNLDALPAVFGNIFSMAFDPQQFVGGFVGSAVMLGIKRGLYSNEAGMGSAPNAAATADVSHPCKQGFVQSLSVYIDTLLICTCSALMVMIFYVQDPSGFIGPDPSAPLNGMPLMQMAIKNSIGEAGIAIITVAIIAFAYSSLIGNYFYAESNFLFITKSKAALLIFRIFCLVAIFLGSVNSFDLAWNLSDIFMGLMAIINLIVILMLGKWAILALKDYRMQLKAGKNPVFEKENIEGLPTCVFWGKEDMKSYK